MGFMNHTIKFHDYGKASIFQDELKKRGCKNIKLSTSHPYKNDRKKQVFSVSVPDEYYDIAKEIGW